MAAPQHETTLYDVHDAKVYPLLADTGASLAYGPGIDVPGIASVSMDPNLLTAELKGDAKIIAKRGRIDKFNVSATYGRLALDVLEVILGGAVTEGANDATYSFLGDNSLPYFKIAFAIDDADTGIATAHLTLYKAQLTGGTLIDQSTDNFGQPTMDCEGIPTVNDDMMLDVAFYSVDTALPA
jgi:hypothetical protein